MNIKVKFEYLQPYLPTARSRKVRFDLREGGTDIEIPDVTGDEFPIVISFNQTVFSRPTGSSIYRGYNRCLYVKEDYTQTSFPLHYDLYIWIAADKDPFISAISVPITDPQALSEEDREILRTYGHDAMKEKISGYFNSYVSFQGNLWYKSSAEPFITIESDDHQYCASISDISPETTIAKYRREYRLDEVKSIRHDCSGKQVKGLERIEHGITLHPDIASYLKLQYDESSTERGFEKYQYNLSTKSFEYVYHGRCEASQTGCVTFKPYDYSDLYRWYYKGTDDEDTVLAAFVRDNPKIPYSKIVSVCGIPVKKPVGLPTMP